MPNWLMQISPKCEELLVKNSLNESLGFLHKLKKSYHLLYCSACYRFEKCDHALKKDMNAKLEKSPVQLDSINANSKELLDKHFKKVK